MNNELVKVETHLHTSEVGPDAKNTAAELIKACADEGYGAVIVTDHFLPGRFYLPEDCDRFLLGYHNARKTGEALGMTILPGIELRFDRGPEDFLIYGMCEDDFQRIPKDICSYPLSDFYEFCKGNGWMVFQAHPYRNDGPDPDPQYIDGVEVFNGSTNYMEFNRNYNDKALAFARKHNLLELVGSDVHKVEGVGRACVYMPKHMLTPKGVVEFLKMRHQYVAVIK